MSSHASSDSHPKTISSHSHSHKQHPHRTSKPPNNPQDYHCYLATHSNPHTSPPHSAYPITQFLSYDKLSFPDKSLALSISSHFEPTLYSKVALIPKWQDECTLSSKLWKLILHDLLPVYLQENAPLVVNGCTKSNIRQMALLKGIKLAW